MTIRDLPTASVRSQALLAAACWTVPGFLLPWRGLVWMAAGFGDRTWLFALPFLALGLAKTLLLDRAVRRTLTRLQTRGRGFILGCFSWKTWLLIAAMPLTGMALRATGIPLPYLGMLYVAIGVALLASSRGLWRMVATRVEASVETPAEAPADAGSADAVSEAP